jgi:hypothetical protein
MNFNRFSLPPACNVDNSTEVLCYKTGDEVLEHYSFKASHLYMDLLSMFMLYLGFHVLGYIFLHRRTKK